MPTTLSKLVPGTPVTRRLAALLREVVKTSRRGSIDIEADSNHSTFSGRVELLATPEASFFVSGCYYYEEYSKGTPLQFNHTEPAARRSAAASAHSTTANCASRRTPAESA
jgi:hypothetical protein